MSRPVALSVHQTLHGYADGHQLLRSSLSLPSAQETQLLLLSDLSGPEYRQGFDGYLTGYPLEGAGYYVLARTWFAHEMPRPGCVWTHSLLLRDDDLPRIRSLTALPFARPTHIGGDASYEEPRNLLIGEEWSGSRPAARTGHVIDALYSTSSTVVVPAISSAEYEDAFLSIFLQQWPRLRRTFRFCSGALLPRDRSFDLVAAPEDALLSVERREGFVVPGVAKNSAPWARCALRDLEMPDLHYRQFLWKYGPDFTAGRRVFALLTDAFLATQSGSMSSQITSLLGPVGLVAPQPTDARRLKTLAFGFDSTAASPELDSLILQQIHSQHPSLDEETIAVSGRTRRLAHTEPELLANLVELEAGDHNGHTPITAECLAMMRADELETYRWPETAVAALVKADQDLCTRSRIWARPSESQRHLFTLIRDSVTDERVEVDTLRMFLLGRHHEVAASAVSAWPAAGIKSFLSIATQDMSAEIPDYIDRTLLDHPDLISAAVRFEKHTPIQLRVCAAYLDPLTPAGRSLPANSWLQCVGSGPLPPNLEVRARVFLLVMGFRAAQFDGGALIAETFSDIYLAVAGQQLTARQWESIATELPRPSYGWDNCKWLVRSAVEVFVQRRWSIENFVRAFRRQPETWRRAVRQLRRTYAGEQYLERVREAHRNGRFSLSDEMSQVLNHNPWWWEN